MKTLKTNKSYSFRFASDWDSVGTAKITKRTPKTVTFIYLGKEAKSKIHTNEDGEFFFPCGQYSMAPRAKAVNEVA